MPAGAKVDAFPILATKLFIPRPQERLVPRPDLQAKLNAGLRAERGGFARRLTLVSAPAGFGKTTLLAEWARASVEPVAWLSLDEGDNDVARFLTYLVAALRRPAPELGEGALALLGATRPAAPERLAISLINDLAARPAEGASDLILILDDYHLITNDAIHDLLVLLLENMPDRLHLALATRADPPLPLSRLRARRQMVEVRQADLQFTAEQAAAFLNDVAGLGLSPAEVAVLHGRSEGWVSGLQMAAAALRDTAGDPGRAERAARVEAFGGSQRYILDYLLEEVLQRQPEAIQRFLLQTAVLPQLSAALCDAVLVQYKGGYPLGEGQRLPDSQAVLEHLEAANLFIVPLDDERRWYRYHHLFADLLARRLQQAMPEEAAAVQRRASIWYEEHGMVLMAIEQALAVDDHRRAAGLIERAAEGMLMRSEIGTLLRLLEALPEAIVQARPRLRAFAGGALLLMGEPLARASGFLSEAEGDADIGGELAAFRALVAMMQGDAAGSESHSRRALAELPPSSHFLRALVVENVGFVSTLRDDFPAAREAFREAVRLGRESGNLLVAVGALCNLAGLHTSEGNLRHAEAIYSEALALACDRHGRRLPIAGKALFGLGDLHREWNHLVKAGAYLEDALALFEQYGEMGFVFAGISLARVRLAQGDAAGAEVLLDQVESQAVKMDSTAMDDLLVAIARVQTWLLQGEVTKAARHAHVLERPAVSAPAFREATEGMLARLRLAEGHPEAARALLQTLSAEAGRKGRRGNELKLSLTLALALEAMGEHEGALSLIGDALAWGQQHGYVRAFLDEAAMPYGRDSLPRLLYAAAERGIQSEYSGRLLGALAEEPLVVESARPQAPVAQELIEPLTARELEVLQLIAAGLSNRAIAERLVLAVSTVKGHTSNIYGKLGVNKRTEAVARAQRLGLLS